MQADVYNRLENNTLLYSLAEVTNAINENVRILNAFTGFYQPTVPLSTLTIPGRSIYEIPSNIIVPLTVRFERRDLSKSSLDSSAWSSRDVLIKKGGAPRSWIPIGLRRFILSPVDSVGGRYLECVGIAETPLLVNPTDSFSLSDEYTEAIEDGSFLTLVLKEGGKILADAVRSVLPRWKSKMQELSRWEALQDPNLSEEVMSGS
jgi:hypothetical protein